MRVHRLTKRLLAAAAPLALAGALAGPGTATASAAVCQAWTGAQPPSPGTTANELDGVAIVSACNVWAAGTANSAFTDQTLIEHWDGASWSRVASPPVGNDAELTAVRALSANDIWAVGHRDIGNGETPHTLIEHWDGTTWSVANSPSPGSDGSSLTGVSVVSTSDAWAVGHSFEAGATQTLILHWDGTSWTQVASPTPGSGGELNGVSAASGSNAWAVGSYVNGSMIQTLILHWDGASWTQVGSPSQAGTSQDVLKGVTATSASNAWAVGWFVDPAANQQQPLVLHWNGSAWNQAGSSSVGISTMPAAVDASPDSTTWEVGNSGDGTSAFAAPLPAPAPAPSTVTVPDVTGLDDSQAQGTLTNAGLTVGTITLSGNCTFAPGTVLRQTPAAGTTANRGTAVNLTEATPPRPHGCAQ
jgi:hypothetical protein